MTIIDNMAPSRTSSATEDDEIHLLDLLQVLAENLRLLVLGPLLIGLLALGISFAITPTFTATTVFMPPQQQNSAAAAMLQSLGALGGIAGAAAGIKNPNDQFVAFLKSDSLQDAMVKRFDLKERYEAKFLADARQRLENNSAITSGKDGLIKIDMSDSDPQLAADMANAYIDELRQLLARLAVTEAQQRRAFFERQLNETKTKLIAAQQALAASGVSISALNTDPTAALEGPARLRAQVVAQEVKLASMRSYLTENAAPFRQAMSELSALRKQLQQAEQQADPKQQTDDGYINKYREFKYQETLFELFARQFELAKVDESRESPVIQVVDIALPPERKSKPKKALIAIMATLLGFFMLLIAVFIRSTWRNGASDPETAAKMASIRLALRQSLGKTA